MKQTLISLALLGAIALCGCSSVAVKTSYDQSATFGHYHTYALRPLQSDPTMSPAENAALRTALRENLAAHGIREASANERADLDVVPQAFSQQQFTVGEFATWGYNSGMAPYGYGGYGLWYGVPTYTSVDTYTEGTLLLHFVDTSTHKVVFRGQAKTIVGSPEENVNDIEKAVAKIVTELPTATGQFASK